MTCYKFNDSKFFAAIRITLQNNQAHCVNIRPINLTLAKHNLITHTNKLTNKINLQNSNLNLNADSIEAWINN